MTSRVGDAVPFDQASKSAEQLADCTTYVCISLEDLS
jgi:hypothetical protein